MTARTVSTTVIPTGIAKLDELLGGGFSSPGLIEIWGLPASGKSILAHYIVGRNLQNHYVYWLDTDRTFRIAQLKKFANEKSMEHLKYALVPTLDTLFYYLDAIESSDGFDILIVIDSLAGIVRSEVVNIAQRNRLMMALLRKLKIIASKKSAVAILTNQVTSSLSGDKATGGSIFRHQMKYVLEIQKYSNHFQINVSSASYLEHKPEPVVFIQNFMEGERLWE